MKSRLWKMRTVLVLAFLSASTAWTQTASVNNIPCEAPSNARHMTASDVTASVPPPPAYEPDPTATRTDAPGALSTDQSAALQKLLKHGIEQLDEQNNEAAARQFALAYKLAPQSTRAVRGMSLATMLQYIPDNSSPDNMQMLNGAVEGFSMLLSRNPNDVAALRALAYLKYEAQDYDASAQYYKRLIQLFPADPYVHTYLSIVDGWRSATLLSRILKGKKASELSTVACSAALVQMTPVLSEAIAEGNRAIELNSKTLGTGDTLIWLYKQRGALPCTDAGIRNADLRASEQLRTEMQQEAQQITNCPKSYDPAPADHVGIGGWDLIDRELNDTIVHATVPLAALTPPRSPFSGTSKSSGQPQRLEKRDHNN